MIGVHVSDQAPLGWQRGAALAAGVLAGLYLNGRWATAEITATHPPVGQLVALPDGHRLHVIEAGEGPPVVLVHGSGMLAQDMAIALADQMAPSYRLFIVDRPGHGWSTRPKDAASPQAQARMIWEGLSALGVSRPVIVGHSLGAAVALAYGAMFPDETAGVVAVAPAAFAEMRPDFVLLGLPGVPGVGPFLSRTLFQAVDRLVIPRFVSGGFLPQPMPERFRREFPIRLLYRPSTLDANGQDFLAVPAGLETLEDIYPNYPVPVTVLTGTADQVIDPEKHAIRLARTLPDAELVELPGLGHMLHHFAPDAVEQAVAGVFRRELVGG